MKKKFLNFFHKEKGQTLLEVVVAVAVAGIIVSSLVALANSSNRKANFSRQATQASKLAQEGFEIVRFIRQRNELGGVREFTGGCISVNNWNDLYNCNVSELILGALRSDATCPNWCLDGNGPIENIDLDTGRFRRFVQLLDNVSGSICGNSTTTANPGGDQIKRVLVRVTWNSPTGSQYREVIGCL